MSKIHKVDQGSETWRRLRLGIPTASRFGDIITAKGERRDTETLKKYLSELVAERILGEPQDNGYQSKWMQRGVMLESEALAAFAKSQSVELDPGGFATTDDGRLGCSPDGIVKAVTGGGNIRREGVEVKVPSPTIHVYYLLYGLGDNYKQQVQGQMFIGDFDVMHFYSYNPGLPPLHIVTQRDDSFIGKLAVILDEFCRELDIRTAIVKRLALNNVQDIAKAMDLDDTVPF